MQEPHADARLQPKGRDALWGRSHGWRNMVVAAGMLTAAAAAALWFAGQEHAPVHEAPAAPATTPSVGPTPAPPSAASPPPSLASAPPPAPPHAAAPRPAPAVQAAPALAQAEPPPAAALPQLAPAEPQACLLTARPAPNRFGHGVVVALEDPATAAALTRKREGELGGRIDPEYATARQAEVRMTNGDEVVFNVPRTLQVRPGDQVATQNIHRSLNLPCNYTPAIITADLGPAPLPAPLPAPSPSAVAATTGAPAEATSPAGDSCPIILPNDPRHAASGVVTAIVPNSQVLNVIARGEAHARGRIDPAYVDLQRIVVDLDGHHNIITVPRAMTVKLGDRVATEEGHRSHGAECRWVPNLVTDDFGPPQTPGEAPGAASP